MNVLRASSAYRWMHCAAYPSLARNADDVESDAAREGTCAAWVAENVINGVRSLDDHSGEMHANGWVVDDEMLFHVERYVALVRSIGGSAEAENTVTLLNGRIVGHFDTRVLSGDTLHIVDLKYGNKVVEVFENWQLLIYAIGSWDLEWSHVVMSIYQPRSAHPDGIYRPWKLTRDELLPYWYRIMRAAEDTEAPSPVATPGRWCAHCPVAGQCVALQQTVYELYDVITSPNKLVLNGTQLAIELAFIDRAMALIDARYQGLYAEAEQRILSGQYVPGYGWTQGKGHRKWKYSKSIVELVTGRSLDRVVTKTPAELERAGVNVAGLTEQPLTKRKIARITESDIRRAFKDNWHD